VSSEHHILEALERILEVEKESLDELRSLTDAVNALRDDLLPTPTPTAFNFTQENPMITEGPGVTQVWTATPAPKGSAFPAGTTFTATPSDTTVSATLDVTGLILTIAYPTTFVPGPTPFNVVVASSTFTPEPSTSPSSVSETVTPTVPLPPTPTPLSFGFVQTT
jgi:hypothetical protein